MFAWTVPLGLVAAVVTAPPPGPAFPDAGRLVAGSAHTCVLVADGSARCWGDNREGQLGDGTREDRPTPTAVRGLSDAVELVAGAHHTCALRRDRGVVCWGLAEDGQLGDGQRFAGTGRQRFERMRGGQRLAVSEPTAVVGLGPVDHLVAGNDLTCALAGADAWCWGQRPRSDAVIARPTRLAEFTAIDELAFGRNYLCARSGGAVSCLAEAPRTWAMMTTPAAIDGIADAIALGAGGNHVCILRASGEVSCLGAIHYAYERDDRVPAFVAPVAIAELTDAVRLMSASAAGHACAVRRSGEVRCWGNGFEGQLGHGLHQPWRRPVAVAGLQGPRALTGGNGHTCALTGDGAALCWGGNGQGQLGWEPPPVEIQDLRVGRRGSDEIAAQLRQLVRGSATPVLAWRPGA